MCCKLKVDLVWIIGWCLPLTVTVIVLFYHFHTYIQSIYRYQIFAMHCRLYTQCTTSIFDECHEWLEQECECAQTKKNCEMLLLLFLSFLVWAHFCCLYLCFIGFTYMFNVWACIIMVMHGRLFGAISQIFRSI